VVFDDIHWAEPAFLDLIEHLADWTRDAPLLLLCVARPELLEIRSGWAGGKLNATTILLEPLAGDEVSHLVDNLLGRAEILSAARTRILEAAEGNPLFVEEMLGMLIDDGLLRFEDGVWRAVDDLADVTVPPTIQLLLGCPPRSARRGGACGDRARGRRGQGVPRRRGDHALPPKRSDRMYVRGCWRSRARS
jgi:predicted ATPase